MTRFIVIALLLTASPAFAADRPIPGKTCYDPGVVTDCHAHWSGSQGGGHGTAENCHKLPDCPKR